MNKSGNFTQCGPKGRLCCALNRHAIAILTIRACQCVEKVVQY